MSYALTTAQANAAMGWDPARLKAYWDARARACQEMGDEGECLAQVARHVPVTIGGLGGVGLGQSLSPADVAAIASTAAGIISNPDATLRAQGPRIVAALDQHVVGPLIGAATQRATPYLMRYLGPPLLLLYIMTGLSTWASYEVLVKHGGGRLTNNKRRRRRKRRVRSS